MAKIRIAIFGISDGIWDTIKNKIDPRKAEIVLFFDNDEMKQGICYENIPIFAPSREIFDKYAVDVCLVAALSAYARIRSQLIDCGVSKSRIQVFAAAGMLKYCMGSIDDIDMELIRQIYFEPDEAAGIINKYREVYGKYSSIQTNNKAAGGWFQKGSLIAHACGGIVNGRQVMYSNSREAFQYSVDNHFRLIECDIMRNGNGELTLGHDYYRLYESEQGQYSRMTVEELLNRLKEQNEISCLIDIKWKDYEDYAFVVDELDRCVEAVSCDSKESCTLKAQIIMEVYDEETIRLVKKKGYDMIFTQYRNPDKLCFMNTVNLCYEYGIWAVAMDMWQCFSLEKFIRIITDKNIAVFAFSTDSIDEYCALRKMGVTGVFTNYLTGNSGKRVL